VTIAIVSGALANKPYKGGEAWVRLSWILGLGRLGYETYFVEELDSADCVDESGIAVDFGSSVNSGYFESVIREFDLGGRAGLLCDGGREVAGLGLEQLRDVAADADLLVNISGHLTIPEIFRGPRTRVYVDLDPGFTQGWHADDGVPFTLDGHDHYVTVGLNVGTSACAIPDCGIGWIGSLPPVVLDEWSPQPVPAAPGRFTTVATWRSPYGPLSIGGKAMGLKHHQFRRMIDLPQRVREATFEVALEIHEGDSADLDALRSHGWKIVDPVEVAGTPGSFRAYVSSSAAEFSVAQGVYTETASGWFSDRTAAYLACGRPAIIQDTGLGDRLPFGDGLHSFSTMDDAATAVRQIVADYSVQSDAARDFAVQHLDSDLVLGRLLSIIDPGAG
jgi:hypothetical protein